MSFSAAVVAALAAAGPTGGPSVTAPHTEGHAVSAFENPRGVVANFDIERLTPFLTELGVTHAVRTTDGGDPFIVASIGDEISFNIAPTACLNSNHTRCIGANFIVFFGGTPNRQTVMSFNQRYAFTSANIVGNGEGAYLLRYEMADYGLPRGNLASSLSAFLHLAALFRAELRERVTTVSAEGYAGDAAARRLNALSLADLTRSPDAVPADAVTTRETVEALVAAGAPMNPLTP